MTKKKTLNTKSALNSDDNILSMYLKEINRIPLLTRKEEDTYARAAATGEKHAKDMLVQSNLRFVVNVAKKYQNQGLPLADLISEGNIGLINAIEKYDVRQGLPFHLLRRVVDTPSHTQGHLREIARHTPSAQQGERTRPDRESAQDARGSLHRGRRNPRDRPFPGNGTRACLRSLYP